ncbi:GCN5 family acetyltransferase [Pontibacter sp. HJ8]
MRDNYTIREATLADIPTLHELAAAIWEPTYSPILTKEQIDYMFQLIYTPEALLQQMQQGQSFLILYNGPEPIGFAAFSAKEEQVYKLNKIYLLPERQGEGLGKLLLDTVEEEVSAQGAQFLDLNVNRHNKAKRFYERCGYHVHQEEDIPIGPYWMNDYIMRKQLP